MNGRSIQSKVRLALPLCLMWALAGVLHGQDGRPHGRKIETSSARDGSVTNLLPFGFDDKNSDSEMLRDELSKGRQWRPSDSLQGAAAAPIQAPPGRIISNERAREREDQRRNWAFTTPDELVPGLTANAIFGLDRLNGGDDDKNPSSAIERFYNHLQGGQTNQLGAASFRSASDLLGQPDANNAAPTLGSGPQPAISTVAPKSFSDLLGGGSHRGEFISPGYVQSQQVFQQRLDSFNEILNSPAPEAPAPVAVQTYQPPTPLPGVLNPVPAVSQAPGTFNGVNAYRTMLGTINSSVGGLPGQNSTPPPPPAPRISGPPRPDFAIPTREFR